MCRQFARRRGYDSKENKLDTFSNVRARPPRNSLRRDTDCQDLLQCPPRSREKALTIPHGTTFTQTLSAITIDAAKILGADDRSGSIEVGKGGDLALYDGDPFEHTSHAIGTTIDGILVSDTEKQREPPYSQVLILI